MAFKISALIFGVNPVFQVIEKKHLTSLDFDIEGVCRKILLIKDGMFLVYEDM